MSPELFQEGPSLLGSVLRLRRASFARTGVVVLASVAFVCVFSGVRAAPPGQVPGQELPYVEDFEGGEAYGWFVDGPSCVLSKSIFNLPKSVAGDVEAHTRNFGKLSVDEEMKIGRQMFEAVWRMEGGKMDANQGHVAYVQGVMTNVSRNVEREGMSYKIHILSDNSVNAFAMPGGYLFVTTGLLLGAAGNEAQLAGVLGHEIAHVDQGHCVAMFQYLRSIMGELGDDLAPLVGQYLRMPYSVENEKEADMKGASLAIKAGYSPFQVVRFIESLPSRPSVTTRPPPVHDPGKMAEYVLLGGLEEIENASATHPRSADRACWLKRAIHKKRKRLGKRQFYVGTGRFKHFVGTAD